MSRRDKTNRFAGKPDFEETRQTNADGKATSVASSKIEPIDADPDETEGTSYFDFAKIKDFFGGRWTKLTSFSKSAAAKTWAGCRSAALWTWGKLKTIPSYCVIRWDSEEETESPVTDTKTDTKKEPVKIESKKPVVPPAAPPTKQPIEEFDEDELAPSRWWNIGIKAATAAAAVLILAGGYFAVKPLFNAAPDEIATDIETVEPVEPPLSPAQVVAVPAPVVAEVKPAVTPSPQQQQSQNAFAAPTVPSPGGAPFDNDPFFAAPAQPVVAETVPSIGADPFRAAPPNAVATSAALQALTALQPLPPLDSVQIASPQPQLQPLVALDSSALPAAIPPMALADAPVAAPASVNAPVAAPYTPQRQNNRQRTTNPSFSTPPTPPPVATLPQTVVERSIVIAEPVPEIVPQIPPSGTVQNVPPPVVVPEPPLVQTMNVQSSEPAPAIPKDAPAASPVVVVPAPAPATELPSPQVLSVATQPIDRQLWEQVREIQNRTEAEPMPLRFNNTAAATTEPALRFTPKQVSPPSVPSESENVLSSNINQFSGLQLTDDLRPDSDAIAIALPALENAPKPVFAEALPAYRDNQSSEGGQTFQNRIDSAISRTPSATETYVIQQGDTYMTISDRFYGTSLLYSALAAHNQKSGIGWRPAEGVVIEIPTAEYLRMHYGEASNRQERRLESQQSGIRYIVQEGDTIFRLATDKLQDSTRWREIYAMNADRIQDVRDLQPGMEILLPVRTAQRN